MEFGLRDEDLVLLTSLVIKPLKAQGATVWIFGSRARGDHKPFSDIDVLFEMPSNKTLQGTTLALIKENTEESRIPFKVDFVEWKDLAESYRSSVMRERVEV